MPKVKTNSGAKKRFKVTATGKIKRRRAFHSHLLTKKSKKRKRHLRQPVPSVIRLRLASGSSGVTVFDGAAP